MNEFKEADARAVSIWNIVKDKLTEQEKVQVTELMNGLISATVRDVRNHFSRNFDSLESISSKLYGYTEHICYDVTIMGNEKHQVSATSRYAVERYFSDRKGVVIKENPDLKVYETKTIHSPY